MAWFKNSDYALLTGKVLLLKVDLHTYTPCPDAAKSSLFICASAASKLHQYWSKFYKQYSELHKWAANGQQGITNKIQRKVMYQKPK